jgi:REP element-mobilizing transposase RayT
MARALRVQPPGGVHHVMSRGVAGLPLFRTAEDRDIFLAIAEETIRRHEWVCLAYVVLGTHYHLLVRTPEPDLAAGMKRLNGHYARGFNRRHGGRGHVLESRYVSVLVETDAHLRWLFRYFAWNPVSAGLCDDPKDWPWSSYPRLLGLGLGSASPPRFLAVDAALSLFGPDRSTARARLRAFVEDAPEPAVPTTEPPPPGEPAQAA